MLKFFLLSFGLVLLLQLRAAAQDTTWCDVRWHKTAPDKAMYFRLKTKTDSGWVVADHFRSGVPFRAGRYLDDSLTVKQGQFRWYDEKGNLVDICEFSGGKANGPEVLYYESGREQAKGSYRDSLREGPWIGYYPSGKLAGTAFYRAGKETDVVLYNEDGSRKTADTIFMRDSEYPGGMQKYLRLIKRELRYPRLAYKHKIEGTVVVKFKVGRDGVISEQQVVQSVSPDLDAEALRVMRKMPDWNPAIVAGIHRDGYKLQPVEFKYTQYDPYTSMK